MQNQYLGDVGDFVKFGLLRAIARDLGPETKLGVLWHLTPDGQGNANDGKYDAYLENSASYRDLDPELFDFLKGVRSRALTERSVRLVEESGLLGSARFFGEHVPSPRSPLRAKWLEAAALHMADADVVFLDPDNGMETLAPDEKHVLWSELAAHLDDRHPRTLVIYQHQDRTAVAADSKFPERQLEEYVRRFPARPAPVAIHSRRGTSRAMVVLPHAKHEKVIRRALDGIVAKWSAGTQKVRLHEPKLVHPSGRRDTKSVERVVAPVAIKPKIAPPAITKPKRVRMTTCTLDGRQITVQEAVAIRENAKKLKGANPVFGCVECGQRVAPHKGGSDDEPHFEHLVKNEDCSR